MIWSVEFFTIDKNDDYPNISIDNKKEKLFDILYSYFLFTIRNIQNDHDINSILGRILYFIGGIIGMLISSYFIYYVHNKMEFTLEEGESYSKLAKLSNPLNKEHKASNVIQFFLILKKIYKDNSHTLKDYEMKRDDDKQPMAAQKKHLGKRSDAFQYVLEQNLPSNNNIINLNENAENEEKRKYIKYIQSIFVMKIKFIVESKNFADNLKVARNSGQSLNDVLKTLGNKLDTNINNMYSKIEVLIKNDEKFLDFVKTTTNIMKNIRMIKDYHTSLIQHLVERHNENVKQMIEIRKDSDLNAAIFLRNNSNLPKKMKSNAFANLNFKGKIQSKVLNEFNAKKRKLKKEYDLIHNISVRKQKSSLFSSKYSKTNVNNAIEERKHSKFKQCNNKNKECKSNQSPQRTRSLDDWKFIKNELKEKAYKRNSVAKRYERYPSLLNTNNLNK
jgi:hypothetical protein